MSDFNKNMLGGLLVMADGFHAIIVECNNSYLILANGKKIIQDGLNATIIYSEIMPNSRILGSVVLATIEWQDTFKNGELIDHCML